MTKKMKMKSILVVLIAGLAIWLSYPPLDIVDDSGNIKQEGKINLGISKLIRLDESSGIAFTIHNSQKTLQKGLGQMPQNNLRLNT